MKQNKSGVVSTPFSYPKYKELSQKAGLEPKTLPTYSLLVNGFFKYLMTRVFNGDYVKLPTKMGTVFIIGKKSIPKRKEDGTLKGLAPDWNATKLLRESNPEAKERKAMMYHLNEHSGGMRYRLAWSKKDIFAENQTFYSFRLSWSNKKTLSKLVFGGKEYIVENN